MRNIRKFYAVFSKQKNRKLNDLMTKWREEGGLHSIPLRDSETLNNALRNKTIIALASDHHANDVEIEFFWKKGKGSIRTGSTWIKAQSSSCIGLCYFLKITL